MRDYLPARQSPTEGLPLLHEAGGQLDAALGGGVRLHGHAEPLGGELLHDGVEAHVLGADEVRHRHADLVEAQLGGVGAQPAHLLQRSRDGDAGQVPVDHQQRDPAGAVAAGAHGGREEVRPGPAGDVELGAGHDVVVAVAHRARAQAGDVRAPVGLGDGQRHDLAPFQDRPGDPLDQHRVTGLEQVRQADAVREQRGDQAGGAAGEDQLLRDDHRIDGVATGTARGLGEADAEQPRLRGRRVERQRQRALLLPRGQVGEDLPLGEPARRGPQRAALLAVPVRHRAPS